MSASRAPSTAALGAWLAPWRERWQALAPREQRLVALAVTLVALAAAWSLLVAPAWRTVSAAPAEIDRLDRQLQDMQRLAVEARELRRTPPLPPAQAEAALRAATERLGERARLTFAGDRATVTFTGVDGAQLRDWLAEVRVGARARPLEAQLVRRGGGFDGTVALALAGTAGGS